MEEKSGESLLKSHLNQEAFVHPGEINAIYNYVPCNEGLATMSGEVDVRFISLLSPFERTQCLVCGRNVE